MAMVPAGAHSANLAAALASEGMRQTLKTASDIYDRVIIDSAAVARHRRRPAAALRSRRRF